MKCPSTIEGLPTALLLTGLLMAALLLTACGKSPASAPKAEAAPNTEAATAPFKMSSIFPDGPGRTKVMNTCGSCHAVVCVARGQRTAERWESIKMGHRDKLADTTSVDIEDMFTYLAANFNDKKPEPRIPPELAMQGCTPF